jgi:hypothetical protein
VGVKRSVARKGAFRVFGRSRDRLEPLLVSFGDRLGTVQRVRFVGGRQGSVEGSGFQALVVTALKTRVTRIVRRLAAHSGEASVRRYRGGRICELAERADDTTVGHG